MSNKTAKRWTKKIRERMEDDDDPWLAPDKLYHFLLCFTLTILLASLALHTRYPFIRRHSILIGSVLSLFAGAAKEVADELGFFKSAGASTRDAIADLIGVLFASFLLHALRFSIRSSGNKEASPNRDILMVWLWEVFLFELLMEKSEWKWTFYFDWGLDHRGHFDKQRDSLEVNWMCFRFLYSVLYSGYEFCISCDSLASLGWLWIASFQWNCWRDVRFHLLYHEYLLLESVN